MTIILAIVVGYLYYSQTVPPGFPIAPPKGVSDDSYAKFKDLKFNFSALNDEQFKKLKTYGDYPIRSDGSGREDIFAPY